MRVELSLGDESWEAPVCGSATRGLWMPRSALEATVAAVLSEDHSTQPIGRPKGPRNPYHSCRATAKSKRSGAGTPTLRSRSSSSVGWGLAAPHDGPDNTMPARDAPRIASPSRVTVRTASVATSSRTPPGVAGEAARTPISMIHVAATSAVPDRRRRRPANRVLQARPAR